MTYVDGSMAAIPTANKDKFLEHARIVADVLKEAGALQVVGCWGDDISEGTETSMPMAVKKKDDETVLFSWITWPDKATRERGMTAEEGIRAKKGFISRIFDF